MVPCDDKLHLVFVEFYFSGALFLDAFYLMNLWRVDLKQKKFDLYLVQLCLPFPLSNIYTAMQRMNLSTSIEQFRSLESVK